MRRIFLSFGFLWAGLCAPDLATAQTGGASPLIDRVLQSYGGRDRLQEIRAYRVEGALHAPVRGADGAMLRISEGPDALKVLVRYPQSAEVRLLERGRGWRGQSLASMAPVQGALLGAMVLQAARANLPWLLDRARERTAITSTDGELAVLRVDVGEGMYLRVFVDRKSHRIIRTESLLSAGPMVVMFATQYSDFRLVSGLLFSFHEEDFASGIHTASVAFQSLELNPRPERLKLPAESGNESIQ